MKSRFVVTAAIIGAAYVALTLGFYPFSFGPVQLRISEALTILPIFTPAAVPGLAVGCAISNMLGGYGLMDVLFGTVATLLGAIFTRYFRKNTIFAIASPIFFNALIVGTSLYILVPDSPALLLNILTVGIGELLACVGFGYPLIRLLRKHQQIFR